MNSGLDSSDFPFWEGNLPYSKLVCVLCLKSQKLLHNYGYHSIDQIMEVGPSNTHK